MKRILRYTMMSLLLSASVLWGAFSVSAASRDAFSHQATFQQAAQDTSLIKSTQTQEGEVKEPRTTRSLFSTWFLQPFRNSGNAARDNEKLVSNVKIFPNPVVETVNLNFQLAKRSEVSVKMMDALGNEILTLFNQVLDAGPQSHSFEIQGKLSTGVYFIRVTAGTETVIKRISVL